MPVADLFQGVHSSSKMGSLRDDSSLRVPDQVLAFVCIADQLCDLNERQCRSNLSILLGKGIISTRNYV